MSDAAKALLLHKLDTLPVLSRVLTRLMELDPEAPTWFDDLVKLVETEPNYAVRLVGAANSLTTRGVAPITRIRDAVIRLGAREVSNLVMSMSVTRVFVPRTEWERGLWLHALEVASVARALTSHGGMAADADHAYLSGLLHDVGRFIMFGAAPDALREVDEAAWDTIDGLVQAERAICGLDHAALGAEACERWSIPEPFTSFVRHHHSPDLEGVLRGREGRIGRLVQVADRSAFSSMSSTHPVVKVLDMSDQDALLFLQRVLPPWYHDKIPGVQAVVKGALSQAAVAAELVGVKRKRRGP